MASLKHNHAVTIYDAQPAAVLGDAISALGGRPVRLFLGPDVEPASAWQGADLVATSPSVNPDYPTTEPRLRHDLTVLRSTVKKGQGTVSAIVSEADLVLRLCPAPTVEVPSPHWSRLLMFHGLLALPLASNRR